MAFGNPAALRRTIADAVPDRPFAIRFWDGEELPATLHGAARPTFTVRSPAAIAHLLRAPSQLGLARAYVSGALAVDDLDALAEVLRRWAPPPIDGSTKSRLLYAAVRACGVQRPPAIPRAELKPRGRRHSAERDEAAVRHHYDVSNEFFAHFLDDSMTYSCAVFESEDESLEDAQFRKRELVCRKLGLRSGMRILDVGCGWGAFAVHAAEHYGVDVVGITLSPPQAERARERATAHGVSDRVDIRVADYRDLDEGPFDAIASIGMVEHVGPRNIDAYFAGLYRQLKPGARLLNHGIARLRHGDPEAGAFSERYVFPDAAPLHLSRIQHALETAGFDTEHVESFHQHYVGTLTHWLANLESDLAYAEALVGIERLNVWRLYLRGARNSFASGFVGLYQVKAHRPTDAGENAP